LLFLADANPYIPAQSWLSSGDTAWQLTAATFVGMQSVPGLAILYAGLAKKKWALNSAVMVFYAFNMSFGNPMPGVPTAWQFLGVPQPAIDAATMVGQAVLPLAGSAVPPLRYSQPALVYFQFVFAAITPILIAGSILGRMNFKAWMIFVPVWSTIVYSVGAYSLWGGGWLAQMGAADFAGGYVIHLAAGISGFVAAAMVGPRLLADRKDFEPNNLIVALAGAGMLWLGWNGFNGGAPLFANHDAAAAVLNTNIATSVALLCWLVLDMFALGHPSAVSMINGMITGLVAITPAAGFVDGYGAIAVGVLGSVVPWFTLNKLGNLSFLKRVDDTFSVIHTHGVAGLMGGLGVGLFANPAMVEWYTTDKKGSDISFTGLFYGNPKQLWIQFIAAAFIVVWNVVATAIILKLISFIVPLRASDGDVEGGDLAIHGVDPIPGYSLDPAAKPA
jgi:Amt family ammonium transporter